MKQYGFKKATDFSAKQINVVFAKAKSGVLKVEKWFIKEMYALADYCGYDDNGSVERDERDVKKILDAVFAGDFEKAQELINETADRWYSLFSKKNQAACDRNEFVK